VTAAAPVDNGLGAIDCAVYHEWADQAELLDYLDPGWREYIGEPGSLPGGAGMVSALPVVPYEDPLGEARPEWYPPSPGRPGSDPAMLCRQAVDEAGVERAILSFGRAQMIPALGNHYLGLAFIRAINSWTLDRWLSPEHDRLYGLVLAPNQLPVEAAAEIRRIGRHERFVGVLMAGNGLSKPFGHPLYHPIYEAAAELELPIVLHAGGDAIADTQTRTAGGGDPATYSEFRIHAAQPLATHVASLIVQGVFERYQRLKVLVVGGGLSWVPSLLWRLDQNYHAMQREAPWLKKTPTSYFHDHIRLSTYPLEAAPTTEAMHRFIGAIDGMGELLCYASGYPHRDADDLTEVARMIPEAIRGRVLFENADALFRWPGRSAAASGASTSKGLEVGV
jgi:predicted TIM-barrel fold metal-dependent hydrolase